MCPSLGMCCPHIDGMKGMGASSHLLLSGILAVVSYLFSAAARYRGARGTLA